MRLNKYLALCGLGSRRAAEQLILDGKVAVGGQTVTELATQVEPGAPVTVEGRVVRPVAPGQFEYIVMNKPRGYDVTRGGRHHHRRAWDLLPEDTHPSVQSVGRLDRDSTGLLLFTNDGDLAYRLAHPRYGCQKTYEAEVEGTVHREAVARLTEGIELDDGPARALRAERLGASPEGLDRLRVVMEEGRNRIVRRMCEAIGHPVVNLTRIQFGPLQLGDLPRGKTRPLTEREVHWLRKAVGLVPDEAPRTSGKRPAGKYPSGQRPAAPRGGRPAGRTTGRPEGRSSSREEHPARPSRRPESPRPTGREERPARGFGSRPEGRPEGPRPSGRPSNRPEGSRPTGRDERPARDFGARPEGRPTGRPEGRPSFGSAPRPRRRPDEKPAPPPRRRSDRPWEYDKQKPTPRKGPRKG